MNLKVYELDKIVYVKEFELNVCGEGTTLSNALSDFYMVLFDTANNYKNIPDENLSAEGLNIKLKLSKLPKRFLNSII